MKRIRELSERVKLCLLVMFLFCGVILLLMTGILYWKINLHIGYIMAAIGAAVLGIIVFWTYKYLVLPYRQTRRLIDAFNKGIIFEEVFKMPYPLCPEFSWMLEKFHLLFNTEETLKLSVEQSRYLALQNQINPHFLYNTLDAIRADAMEAGIREVAKTAEALSTFFGYSISNLDKYAMLAEELENVKDYMTIQQYRFGDKLQLLIENRGDDAIFNFMVPRMTLQPLVENAIYHGLEEKAKMGTVSIIIHNTDQMLIINVIDDGVGMDNPTADKLNATMNRAESGYTGADQKKKGGIALKNVNSRIKLLFGADYGLHIFSEINVGTDVRIMLPIVKKESLDEKRVSEN